MSEHNEDEKQAAPITLRRSSQKGHECGWTIALPPDATWKQTERWVRLAWSADEEMRSCQAEMEAAAFSDQLEATLKGEKQPQG